MRGALFVRSSSSEYVICFTVGSHSQSVRAQGHAMPETCAHTHMHALTLATGRPSPRRAHHHHFRGSEDGGRGGSTCQVPFLDRRDPTFTCSCFGTMQHPRCAP